MDLQEIQTFIETIFSDTLLNATDLINPAILVAILLIIYYYVSKKKKTKKKEQNE